MTTPLCIVTGASRGFGQSCCVALALHSQRFQNATFILLGRDKGLEQTRSLLEQHGIIRVILFTVDFDQLDGLEKSLDQLWTVLPPQPHFNPVLLVNNAGSLGRLAPIHQLCLQDVRQALDMNVTAGCIYFTLHFLRRIGHSEEIAGSKETQISTTASTSSTGNNDATVSSKVSCSFSNVTVVHISSLAAIAPFQNMSLYCTGKAARDMFHRCIGEEYPTVRVLNYAPGPMETQMQRVLREQLPESQVRTSMVEMFQNGQLVCKDDSARVLISVLDKNTFETGAHIDYYDVAGK